MSTLHKKLDEARLNLEALAETVSFWRLRRNTKKYQEAKQKYQEALAAYESAVAACNELNWKNYK